MRIELAGRRVEAGVRELAAWDPFRRGESGRSGRWRAETGRRWHQEIQREKAGTFEAERVVRGELPLGRWTLWLEGRCDLYREGGASPGSPPPLCGEIKTVLDALPLPAGELRARYPAHFRQLALYRRLLTPPESPGGTTAPVPFLLFLSVDTGIRQEVRAGEEDEEELSAHLERFAEMLADREERARRRARLTYRSLREQPRPGQAEALGELERAGAAARVVALQAPTGFGKTRLLLEYGLQGLREGRWERILYLSGKTSGQIQVLREWEGLFPAGEGPLRAWRMRNHREHHAACTVAGCRPEGCSAEPGAVEGSRLPHLADLLPAASAAEPGVGWEHMVELAESCRACPSVLSRALLGRADFWLGDYNYLLAPSARHIFLEEPDLDPARTLLLVDEAHNLGDRVADALAAELRSGDLRASAAEWSGQRRLRPVRSSFDELAGLLEGLPAHAAPPEGASFPVLDLVETLRDQLREAPIPWREATPAVEAAVRSIEATAFLLGRDELEPFFWADEPGRLRCLPAVVAPWLTETWERFHQSVLFAATLDPIDSLAAEYGIPAERLGIVRAEGNQTGPYRTAIDARVDTRQRAREKHYGTTAVTAAALAENAPAAVAVFFPSHAYAEAVETYLGVTAPHLRVERQPVSGETAVREEFLRWAPRRADLLLLVLGGSFAEAVDELGEELAAAMVVGPGLPEWSALRRYRSAAFGSHEEGFHQLARIPGMRRVNQAIGRLGRNGAEGGRAGRVPVLLHDRRFLEEEYRGLLRSDLGEVTVLRRDGDLRRWLAGGEG
jgi:Rad3-related DNA helicase